ncbi:Uma2 family endonuclease [Aerosakkonema funiforme]|uniref:Uma2 family endonuclease n=1 Tax=Aerosakkonema funiforme TaxID=1246630 RepID=UPI0035B70E5D
MTEKFTSIELPPPFPDHTQLPEEDGTFVKNFQEHPQSIILTDSLGPVLQQLHPDGQYAIGQDCGIYWRETDPPEQGAEAPDWFYIPNVPPLLDGQYRRCYVLWREFMAPLIVLEFASGDGSEERDRTPLSYSRDRVTRPGKFWVYERIVRTPYYGIYEVANGKLEVYHFVDGSYRLLEPNERGHYPILPLGVELGLWHGSYQNQTQLWLRWWDSEGNLLLTGSERAELESLRAEQERQRAEQERQRAESAEAALASAEQARRDAVPQLLAMGLSVEQVASALGLTVELVRQISLL